MANLKKRLSNEMLKTSKKAMRDPRNAKEYAVRVRLHRLESIVRNRYGQDYMFELQGQRVHKAEV